MKQNNKTEISDTEQQIKLLQQQAILQITNYMDVVHLEKDGHIIEHVAMILSENEDGITFDQEAAWNYQNACLQLLVLLSNPEVSKKLDNNLQSNIGIILEKMYRFFGNIDDGACMAALYLYQAENSENERDLQYMTNLYKRLLKERQFLDKL